MKAIAVLEKFGLTGPIEKLFEKHPGFGANLAREELEKYTVAALNKETKIGGYCNYGLKHISINYRLFAKENVEDFKKTLLHEVAHAIAYNMFKSRGHDKRWKYVAQAIGDDGGRCHNYQYLTGKQNWCYACKTCGHETYADRRWKRGKFHTACFNKHGRNFKADYGRFELVAAKSKKLTGGR